MMIHSYGIWARLASLRAARSKDHPALTDEAPVTEAEIQEILKNGIANHEPVEIGFETKDFSQDLHPAARALGLADVPPGKLPPAPQDWQNYYIWVAKAPAEIKLRVMVRHKWNHRPHRITLYSPKAVDIREVDHSDMCKPDGVEREVVLKTPYDGLHRIQVRDGGDHTFIKWPKGMPVSLPSAMDTKGVKNHFRGGWSLYFYVPKGTTLVGGWASRIANWAPRVSGQMVDGDGNVVYDFGKAGEGWFTVPVPKGRDGKLWMMRNSQGDRRLLTVPPYFVRTASDLLLPKEVVDADRTRNE